jgi:hypothetical protein
MEKAIPAHLLQPGEALASISLYKIRALLKKKRLARL